MVAAKKWSVIKDVFCKKASGFPKSGIQFHPAVFILGPLSLKS
jgi:hypothetical protein